MHELQLCIGGFFILGVVDYDPHLVDISVESGATTFTVHGHPCVSLCQTIDTLMPINLYGIIVQLIQRNLALAYSALGCASRGGQQISIVRGTRGDRGRVILSNC